MGQIIIIPWLVLTALATTMWHSTRLLLESERGLRDIEGLKDVAHAPPDDTLSGYVAVGLKAVDFSKSPEFKDIPAIYMDMVHACKVALDALTNLHIECRLGGVGCLECTAIERLKSSLAKARGES